MKIHFFISLFLIFSIYDCFAQEDAYEEIKNNEISIPSAPAFALLGVNPEMVMRPSDIKSFKVDWRIKNYNLAPDLALEAQPLWHFYYKNKPFNEYLTASRITKKLSTASLSFGTAKVDGINHASYAIKLNLFQSDNIMNDEEFIRTMSKNHQLQVKEIDQQIDSIVYLRYSNTDPTIKEECEILLDDLRQSKRLLNQSMGEEFRMEIAQYQAEHWNRTMLDIAFGSVYTYDNGGFDSLKVKRAGYGIWLNGCIKAGKNGLVSGIARYTKIQEKANQMLGLSYRYGNQRYNFYVEGMLERLNNYFDPNLENPYDEDYFSLKHSDDLGSSWIPFSNEVIKTQFTISYGGDFKLSRNILLNFALRSQFTKELKINRLIPVANVVCLMK